MGFSAPVRAAFWMSGALLSFMAMAVSGRELSAELETYHILFFRSVIGVFLIGALIAYKGTHLLKNSASDTSWTEKYRPLCRAIRLVLWTGLYLFSRSDRH